MSVSTTNLGRIEKVKLRDVWQDEAHDFTPWLAMEENLDVLADTLEMDLKIEATEQSVGQYRADIVCKDLSNDNWVLIENQLEKTDHSHLGQLITYAAGLDAVSIVWIAETFSDQHRAALDWLNEQTNESLNFFGLQIELWRIDESPVAPKFNLVSRPNSWTKGGGGVGPVKRPERLEYWTKFREYVVAHASDLKPSRVADGASMDVGVGWSGLNFKVGGYDDADHVFVRLSGRRDVRQRVLSSIHSEQIAIEKEFGGKLFRRGDKAQSTDEDAPHGLQTDRSGSIKAIDDWENQFAWYVKTIRKLKDVLGPRIQKQLDSHVQGPVPPSVLEEIDEEEFRRANPQVRNVCDVVARLTDELEMVRYYGRDKAQKDVFKPIVLHSAGSYQPFTICEKGFITFQVSFLRNRPPFFSGDFRDQLWEKLRTFSGFLANRKKEGFPAVDLTDITSTDEDQLREVLSWLAETIRTVEDA
jgi:hypothetical protein